MSSAWHGPGSSPASESSLRASVVHIHPPGAPQPVSPCPRHLRAILQGCLLSPALLSLSKQLKASIKKRTTKTRNRKPVPSPGGGSDPREGRAPAGLAPLQPALFMLARSLLSVPPSLSASCQGLGVCSPGLSFGPDLEGDGGGRGVREAGTSLSP